jgi:hypothetical protein
MLMFHYAPTFTIRQRLKEHKHSFKSNSGMFMFLNQAPYRLVCGFGI